MKKIIYSFVLIFCVQICFANTSFGQNYEIHNGDTINKIDANNLKQGMWIFFGKDRNMQGYDPDQVVEEGEYKNSRKSGLWTRYYPNGNKKNEITYKRNRPNGFYRTYYENGQVEEEGVWKNNRNTGDFKRYYENGEVSQDFSFNESGKREGEQKYFYENGELMIEGEWAGGKESGVVKEYFPNGELKAEKNFENGKLNAEKTKIYEASEPVVDREEKELEKAPVKVVKVEKDEKPNVGVFDGNGYHKLYNMNKQISKDGHFKNHKLIDGKWYRYDDDGILTHIEVYKNGRYVGNAVIEEDDQ